MLSFLCSREFPSRIISSFEFIGGNCAVVAINRVPLPLGGHYTQRRVSVKHRKPLSVETKRPVSSATTSETPSRLIEYQVPLIDLPALSNQKQLKDIAKVTYALPTNTRVLALRESGLYVSMMQPRQSATMAVLLGN